MALENRPLLLSYADYMRLPPETPGEVIDGELIVRPSPNFRHQAVAGIIFRAIGNFLDDHPEIGVVSTAPMDCVLRANKPAVIVQPDLLFVSAAREHIIQDVIHGAPDLAVEVVSPGTFRTDNVCKRELYAQYGVQEYWLVWPEEEGIDVFTLGAGGTYGPARAFAPGESLTTELLPGFALSVARVFAGRHGEPAGE